jgi:hypothetical protein
VSLLDSDKPRYHYQGVDPLLAATLQQRTTGIRRRLEEVAQGLLDIGRDLRYVRDHLLHGEWIDWLQAEFAMSEETARNWLHVWDRFGNTGISLGNLRRSVIYLLAAPSTPDTAVEEICNRDSQGEHVTVAEAQEAIREHRQTADQPAAKSVNFTDLASPAQAETGEETEETLQEEETEETPQEEEETYDQRLRRAEAEHQARRETSALAGWQGLTRDVDALLERLRREYRNLSLVRTAEVQRTAQRTAEHLDQLSQRIRQLALRIRERIQEVPS